MKKIHKKVMALLLAALMITSVMDTHVQAESSTEANNISVVNDGTGDAEEVSDVEKKEESDAKKKEESYVTKAGTEADTEVGMEAVKEEVEGSADDEEKKDVVFYKAKNEVVDGIRKTGSLFARKKILINETCSGLLDELGTYMWDEKSALRGEERPIKQQDHGPDALRYYVNSLPGWRLE